MGKLIQDELAAIPMTRQQKWQIRKKKQGRCVICGTVSAPYLMCAKHRDASYSRRKKNPLKKLAWEAVTLALSTGKIKRGHCHCGKLGQAHHNDYYKPLEIDWLCHRHHQEHHGKRVFSERPVKILDPVQYQQNYQAAYRKQKV